MNSHPASERRLNLLTGDWVLVSPHRAQRPWQGAIEVTMSAPRVAHDPDCYLCPGALRAGGARNPQYTGVHVFANDFPALLAEAPTHAAPKDLVFVAAPERGRCRVVCYSPHHSLPMSDMTPGQIRAVVDVWANESTDLAAEPDIAAVTVFENRGEMMGASNPHPHGQIWATESVPNELEREDRRQHEFLAEHGEALLAAYLRRELEAEIRIVAANDAFVAVVPFWAAWPFETLVLPRRAVAAIDALDGGERDGLAAILGRLTAGYDRLFGAPFPYSMGFHQAPADGRATGHFTMHAHFYPPLLRGPSVRKFMVGFEMLAMAQRDLTPEDAAQRLRAVM